MKIKIFILLALSLIYSYYTHVNYDIFFFLQKSSIVVFKDFYPKYYFLGFVIMKSIFPIIFSLLLTISLKLNLKESLVPFILLFLLNILLPFKHFEFFLIIILLFVLFKEFHESLKNIFFSTYSILQKNSSFIWFIAIVIIVLVRLLMVFYTDNAPESDAKCRAILTQIWADYYTNSNNIRNIIIPIADWPPLDFYISGIILKITDSYLYIRIFHALTGILSAYWVYKISNLLFNKKIAQISSLAYLIYPASIMISIQIMSEPLFILLILISFYHFLRYNKYFKTKDILIHILFINLACYLRFEAWPTLLFFGALLIFNAKLSISKKVFFLLLYSIAPLIITWGNIAWGFGAFKWLTYSDFQVKYSFENYGEGYKTFIDNYKKSFIPLAFISAIIVLVSKRNNKLIFVASLFSIFLFAPFLVKSINMTLFPQYRYLIIYQIFFLPFLVYLLYTLFKKEVFITAILTIILTLFGSRFIYIHSYQYHHSFKETIKHTQSITEGSFIIDYYDGSSTYEFIAQNRLPLVFDYEDDYISDFADINEIKKMKNHKRKITFLMNDKFQEFKQIDTLNLNNAIQANTYLILFPEGGLKNYFNFEKEVENYDCKTFTKIFDENGFLIYYHQ